MRIVTTVTLLLLFIPYALAQDLGEPVRLEAGGKPMDAELGLAAPFFHDFDGDGKRDLLLGQFRDGRLKIFRNIGTDRSPQFGPSTWFEAGGRVASVPSGCCVGFSPQVVDLDGDGSNDVITGSVLPGDIYFFRRLAGNKYAGGVPLKDARGRNLNGSDPRNNRSVAYTSSVTSTPFLVDYDDDGDLDLLVGNIEGFVVLIINEGAAKKPSFNAKKRRLIHAGKEPIEVPGGRSGPVAADWDGDGRTDLIVGAGDGSVWWYRNLGRRGEPEYADGIAIVPKSRISLQNPLLYGIAPGGPGMRTKVCVTDWNGDGLMDLLVGDIWSEQASPELFARMERAMSSDDRSRVGKLKTQYDALGRRLATIQQNLGLKAKADPKFRDIKLAMSKVKSELTTIEPMPTLHGSVWLFLRKPRSDAAR